MIALALAAALILSLLIGAVALPAYASNKPLRVTPGVTPGVPGPGDGDDDLDYAPYTLTFSVTYTDGSPVTDVVFVMAKTSPSTGSGSSGTTTRPGAAGGRGEGSGTSGSDTSEEVWAIEGPDGSGTVTITIYAAGSYTLSIEGTEFFVNFKIKEYSDQNGNHLGLDTDIDESGSEDGPWKFTPDAESSSATGHGFWWTKPAARVDTVPTTGGIGAGIIYIAGLAMIGGSLALLFGPKLKRAWNRNIR